MPFIKGKSGNEHGRPLGAANKSTQDLRKWINLLLEKNLSKLEKDLALLEPKDRWAIVEKLLQYTVPKMSTIDANVDISKLSDEQLNTVITQLSENIQSEE